MTSTKIKTSIKVELELQLELGLGACGLAHEFISEAFVILHCCMVVFMSLREIFRLLTFATR